jgi:hypothetical protein
MCVRSAYSTKHLHHEIVLDLQAHVACLGGEQMAAVRQDLADNRRAAVLAKRKKHTLAIVGTGRCMWKGDTHKDTNLLLRNPSLHNVLKVSLQDVIEVRPSEVARQLQTRQSRVGGAIRAVAVEQVAEDVRRNVLALRRDVRVDVELEVAVGGQRAGAVDRAI